MTTTIRLRGPVDVIAVLPYQLGFHPTDSIVVVAFKGRRLALVERLDLPPPGVDPADVAAPLLPPLLREEPDRTMIIGYESDLGDSDAASDALQSALAEHGIPVVERLVVRDGRWYSRDCTGGCCPVGGTQLPPVGMVPAEADFVALGRSPCATRDELGELVRPVDGPIGAALLELADRLLAEQSEAHVTRTGVDRLRRQAFQDWARLLGEGDDTDLATTLPPEVLVRLAVSLRDVELRDFVIAWICPETLPVDLLDRAMVRLGTKLLPDMRSALLDPDDPLVAQRVEARLVRLCRHAPRPFATGPLAVLASFAWWRGHGALTRVALERALEIDPDYRLAQLMERVVDLAIRPRRSA